MYERKTRPLSIIKRATGVILAMSICIMLPMTALSVSASEDTNEMLDPSRTGSITVTFINPKTKAPVGGGNKIGLYKVADVKIDDGFKFEYTEQFANVDAPLAEDEDLDADLAAKLDTIIKNQDLSPDCGEKAVDSEGTVTFNDLELGLYLAVQTAKGTGDDAVTIDSFLVSVPIRNTDGTLNYDVEATPKSDVVPPPDEPEPVPPIIPQTGQLWWPVMALGGAGALFLAAGIFRKFRNE